MKTSELTGAALDRAVIEAAIDAVTDASRAMVKTKFKAAFAKD